MPLPGLASLVAVYPNGSADDVANLVGGTVKSNFFDAAYTAYKDTCAIRISRALNSAGAPIPAGGGGLNNPYMEKRKIRTDQGGDSKWYIYSTYDMRAYLDGKYGGHKTFPATTGPSDLAALKGIIGFGFYHLDLWDGTKCVHHAYFGHAKATEIILWVC
jgi:hypothetical protein